MTSPIPIGLTPGFLSKERDGRQARVQVLSVPYQEKAELITCAFFSNHHPLLTNKQISMRKLVVYRI